MKGVIEINTEENYEIYKKIYFMLFNSITDALTELEKKNYGLVQEILRKGQMECEERYIGN